MLDKAAHGGLVNICIRRLFLGRHRKHWRDFGFRIGDARPPGQCLQEPCPPLAETT